MIYVKRLLANDIPTGKQFAIPSYIADPFFGVITEDGDWERDITLHYLNEDAEHPEHDGLSADVKLYPYPDRDESRFTVDINNLLREILGAKPGDIFVLIQGRTKTDYSFRLVRQNDTERFKALSRLFVDAELAKSRAGGHALLDIEALPNVAEYIILLKENHNLVLTGAPGTGKTHLAMDIADQMQAETKFVQFHPSYDYTDFIEGLRPDKKDGFSRKDGAFKAFCKEALRHNNNNPNDALASFKQDVKDKGSINIPYLDSEGSFKVSLRPDGGLMIDTKSKKPNKQSATDELIIKAIETGQKEGNQTYPYCVGVYIRRNYLAKDYVFIIDEINRGEISKIFGESFFAIDPGYRDSDVKVTTQYQELITDKTDEFKDGFFVPRNVYIIGTMNDIDRSVESMDFAIRRRFAWREVTAAESAVNMNIDGLALQKMQAINDALMDNGLTEAYWIGGAYFLNVKNNDFKALGDLRLKGVVSEYFRGDPDASDKIKDVEKKYFAVKKQSCEDTTESGGLPEGEVPSQSE